MNLVPLSVGRPHAVCRSLPQTNQCSRHTPRGIHRLVCHTNTCLTWDHLVPSHGYQTKKEANWMGFLFFFLPHTNGKKIMNEGKHDQSSNQLGISISHGGTSRLQQTVYPDPASVEPPPTTTTTTTNTMNTTRGRLVDVNKSNQRRKKETHK